jgi:hypothetical protein
MNLDLQTHINSKCCSTPLNIFTFAEGTVPTIEDFETMIGFTLNGAKINGNSIEFSNKNYVIETERFQGNYNLVSIYSQAKVLENVVFAECENLLTAEFPALTDVGTQVMNGCYQMTSFIAPNLSAYVDRDMGVTSATNSGTAGQAFLANTGLTTYTLETTYVPDSAFGSCDNLVSLSFPNATTLAQQVAFECPNLTTVSAPLATSLGNAIFQSCTSLININFPLVQTLGNSVFKLCTSLATIDLPQALTLGDTVFQNCYSATTYNLPLATTFGVGVFYGNTSLVSITLPSALNMGADSFYGCSSMTTVSLPEVLSMGNSSFSQVVSLTSLNLPKVTNLGSTPNFDGTFENIVGNVIAFTLKSGLEIDQDVIILQANNTVTLTLV